MVCLNTYLNQNKFTQTEFADIVGSTPSTICRICSGKRFPGRELVRRIVSETDGEVSAADLLGFDVSEPSEHDQTIGVNR